MTTVGNRALMILYSVLFCLVTLGWLSVPSFQLGTAYASSAQEIALEKLTDVKNLVEALPNTAFNNPKNQKALLNKINATFNQLETEAALYPLCEYPTWPKYVGGDPDSASSFVCVNE